LCANRAFVGKGSYEGWSPQYPTVEVVMNPGEQKTFRTGDGNAVVLAVGVWTARDGIPLRIDSADDGAHMTITNRPGAVGEHRILFRGLRRMLMINGCWISGDEGAEADASGSAED